MKLRESVLEILLSCLDFRRDGVRDHHILSSLNNEESSTQNESLVRNENTYHHNKEQALALTKFYASVCKLPHMKLPRLLRQPPLVVLTMMSSYSIVILF